jgi:hypothetical protein
MASTYVNDLRLNEMATGDGSGTWGTTTNTNLELIAEAFSYGTEVITTNADTHTTTIADGATDPGRSLYLKYTGTLDSACTITIGPNTVSKVWIIENGTSGSQDIIISQGSGANITIPAGDTKVVYSDGAGAGAAFVDAFASLSVVDLKVQDDLTVTGDIDVDGTTNLDVVDIDGAVDMASTALVTGVLTANGGAVFNETGADVDFRVESDTVDHALFVQGSDGNVGIGTSSPLGKLSVGNGSLTDANVPIQISTSSDGGEAYLGVNRNGGYGALFGFAADATYKGLTIRNIVGNGTSNADGISFATNNTDVRMHITGAGSVGIGTSSPSQVLHLSTASTSYVLAETTGTGTSAGFRMKGDASADYTLFTTQGTNQFAIYDNAASTERLRINSSGNVSIGSSFASGVATRVLTVDDPSNAAIVVAFNGATALNLYADADEANIGSYLQGANMKFFTTPSGGSTTERMRITNAGYTKMSPNGTYVSAASSYHEVNQNLSGITSYIYNSSATGDGLLVNVNNESTYFFLAGYSDSAARYNVYIFSNGNLVNRNNSYGALSDQKLKQDIEDASSQWEDVKAMQFRKYRWKQDVAADVDAPYQLGVIAQELEASGMSGLIEESPDREFYDEVVLDSDGNPVVDEDGNNVTEQKERLTGESTKSVKYSILTMKALVALQEAMTRIESLEARITTLENA